MKFLIQVSNSAPDFMRKHWHSVDAGSPKGAVEALLVRSSNAVPRLAAASRGKLYAMVAPETVGKSANVRPNGVPIMIYGFDVMLGGKR